MTSGDRDNAIVIDSDDDDRKPAAVPSPRRRKRKRQHQPSTSKAESQFDTNITGNGISRINQDVLVLSSDSENECQEGPLKKRKESSSLGCVARKPEHSQQHQHADDHYELRTSSDFLLAKRLQEQENQTAATLSKAKLKKDHEEMTKSPCGKAVLAVQQILAVTKHIKAMDKYQKFAQDFDAVSTDDMVFLAKNLLEMQAKFLEKGIPAYIDIGFHFTNSTNLDSIRTNGLMTKKERDSQGIKSDRYNGSVYGDGVYTCDHPRVFSKYGDTGLIVGRLIGTAKEFQAGSTRSPDGDENSIIAPQLRMVVLKTSAQCLPMIKYNTSLVASKEGKHFAKVLRATLQQTILDKLFNPGLAAPPKSRNKRSTAARKATPTTMPGTLPPHPASMSAIKYRYTAPERLSGSINTIEAFCSVPASCNFQNNCVICHDALGNSQSCVALKVCNHVFHKDCIKQSCKFGSKCPTCRISIGTPIGKSPSGSMTIIVTNGVTCGGFPNCGTIMVSYSIRSGTQKHYHENPGQAHGGKHDAAFIPNNAEGQNLLKRLKFAFMHGLTFTVGTSMTTGAANQCTWSSIHHKTSPNGGVHGFPDPNYFVNCNRELDSVNVPGAHELDSNGKKLN